MQKVIRKVNFPSISIDGRNIEAKQATPRVNGNFFSNENNTSFIYKNSISENARKRKTEEKKKSKNKKGK